jgi:nitrite reductase/ring-hydroxylating ferredoxin subunit
MRSKLLILPAMAIITLVLLAVSGCSQSESAGKSIKAIWITASLANNAASIPVSEVEKDVITHFKVKTPTQDLAFMAYQFDGKLYARADICPPCGSENFSLKGDTLVCDTCGTVFNAATGVGVKGACVKYPKQIVPYQIKDGNLVMNGSDLQAAFQNTLKPGKP